MLRGDVDVRFTLKSGHWPICPKSDDQLLEQAYKPAQGLAL